MTSSSVKRNTANGQEMMSKLANGHTLEIYTRATVDFGPRNYHYVEERNSLGTRIGIAFGSFNREECERWVKRAQERGYGYAKTIG